MNIALDSMIFQVSFYSLCKMISRPDCPKTTGFIAAQAVVSFAIAQHAHGIQAPLLLLISPPDNHPVMKNLIVLVIFAVMELFNFCDDASARVCAWERYGGCTIHIWPTSSACSVFGTKAPTLLQRMALCPQAGIVLIHL